MAFAEKLKAKRMESGLTLQQLADRTNVSKTYLWELENQPKNPSARIVKQLAIVLSTTVAYLIGDLPVVSKTENATIADAFEALEARVTKLEKWISRKI